MRKTAVAIFLLHLTVLFVMAALTSAATISVDAQDVTRPVNRLVFGNAQDFGHGDYFLDKHTWSFDPDAMDLVQELHPTVLRFPGGCHADQYFWEDGIGPHHLRPSPRPGQYEHFGFDYGTDEHLQLCAQVGAEALMTVNYASGIVANSLSLSAPLSQRVARAADWVEYCNTPNDASNPNGGVDWAAQRAQNGHPQPYNIRFWEIGNEIYHRGQIGNVDVHTYAYDVIAFSNAMKAVDPSILIGAVGPSRPYWNRWWIPGSPDWNPTLLSICYRHIDYLVVHCYYPGPNEVEGEDLCRAGLAGGNQALSDLSELRAIIDQYDPAIGIVPGENGFSAGIGEDWERWELSTTLLAGLHLADLLMVFLEKDAVLNIPFACGWKLLSDTPNAEIGYQRHEGSRWIRPEYFVYQLYQKHFGDFLVSSSVSCGSFSTINVAQVEEMSAVPELSVCASVDSASEKLYLMVVNKQLQQEVSTTIQIDGLELQPEANLWTLNGPDILASNEEHQTVDITTSTLGSVKNNFSHTFPAHSVTVMELAATVPDTSEPDILPPTISLMDVADISGHGARVTWMTDEPAASLVEYGTVSGEYTCTAGDTVFRENHDITLDSLWSETRYFFRAVSRDTAGNVAASQETLFVTLDVTAPIVEQMLVTAITESSAAISWRTNEPADSRIEYGREGDLSDDIVNAELTLEHHFDLLGLEPAMRYHFWISSTDSADNLCQPQEGLFQTASPRSAAADHLDIDGLPSCYSLSQNFPNPFNASTSICYQLPKTSPVVLQIFNTRGQLVRTLVHQEQMSGRHRVIWDGKDDHNTDAATGVYFCSLQAEDFRDVRKMTLLR